MLIQNVYYSMQKCSKESTNSVGCLESKGHIILGERREQTQNLKRKLFIRTKQQIFSTS